MAASLDDLHQALINADAAGDTAGAQAIADHIRAVSAPPQAAPQQPNDATFGQRFSNLMGGLSQAPYDILQSAAELGAGLDATGLTKTAYPGLKAALDQGNQTGADISGAQPDSGFYKGGRIAGQIAATAPLSELNIARSIPFLAKFPLLAKAISGATQGGSAALLTSNSSDAPLADQVGLGMAGGAALPLAGAALRGVGNLGATVIGGVTTGAGANSIKGAYQAGVAGGATGKAFTDSMRGNTPWSQVVTDAKAALGNMRVQRNAAYRSGMADVSKDATVLDFQPVDAALSKINDINRFKGQDLSPATTDVRQQIFSAVNKWKGLDPAEYHTPEGFDALKQQIGDIKDSQPFGSAQRTIASDAYNAVRKTIADQAPVYDKVMSGYSKASDELDNIQRELSLGPKGNPNTALRKLQSVMRDNVNTSWGDRTKYASTLAANGAPNLMPSLAGQALSTFIPRGLAKYGDLAALTAGGFANLPATAAALPFASPRLMGEAAYGLGAANRGISNIGAKTIGALAPGATAPNLGATSLGVLLPYLLANSAR